MQREARTIEAMIEIYCQDHHGPRARGELCTDCATLLDYAGLRLEKCPFQEHKTTCTKCPVHCYKPDMRERVREVMRYSGPRMVYKHPWLAIMHLLVDSRRDKPMRAVRQRA
ncbi:MAG: hypothetical protein BWY52_02233 [Chloroflexi bacterium ADurb.Bin325]|nr:MAG: hypothetical protein BWY52_02233 [Chloroflexi bacterium ADurb.Bin325]